MLKRCLPFLTLLLLAACGTEERFHPNAEIGAVDRPEIANIPDLHPSVLAGDWWRDLSQEEQLLVGREISPTLTMEELNNRFVIARKAAATVEKAGACPGFPANPEGDVELNSQADVNAFGALGCKSVIGRLRIVDTLGPDPICDLTPLSKIKEVGSSFNVNSDCITSLAGLEKLKSVGELGPFGFTNVTGANVTDIEALAGLKTVTGTINIIDCDLLTSVTTAYSGITSIDSGKVTVPLTSIYSLNISGNDALTELSAFSGLTNIDGSLLVQNNLALPDLDDLSGLNKVGTSIFIFNNDGLLTVNELSNLTSISTNLWVIDNGSLTECCGVYNLLCSDPPFCTTSGVGGATLIVDNGAGCTEADIVAGGDCP